MRFDNISLITRDNGIWIGRIRATGRGEASPRPYGLLESAMNMAAAWALRDTCSFWKMLLR
jgi:hypothetical protein